ncbi:MAG: hypothetical protein LBL95_03320 [Deltaproteobacteria bacterium]|jgi:hypothetical protein|nr:hypothetical protein [Deltaproteobacteria bacterium]
MRRKGTETALSSGEMVRFNDTDSKRLGLGTRMVRDFGEKASVFAGAACEHEFGGQARAPIGGREMEPPSLRGDTCLGELGLTMRPTGGGLTVELDLQGYLGKRQGATASLLFKYWF